MYYQPPRALGLLVGTILSFWAAAVALPFGLPFGPYARRPP